MKTIKNVLDYFRYKYETKNFETESFSFTDFIMEEDFISNVVITQLTQCREFNGISIDKGNIIINTCSKK